MSSFVAVACLGRFGRRNKDRQRDGGAEMQRCRNSVRDGDEEVEIEI